MTEHDMPPDMLPIDYAGVLLGMSGVAIALVSAILQDPWIMVAAAGVSTIGAALKLKGTWYKARLDREREVRKPELE